jgi:predicted RNA-binding protein YlqC (UPF0109 family)
MDHSSLKDLVEFMAKALVDKPDEVERNRGRTDHGSRIESR